MWMKREPSDKSVTLTFFTLGFVIALGKLLMAGLKIGTFEMGAFSGTDFAAVVGALGGVYALRKMTPKDKDDSGPS